MNIRDLKYIAMVAQEQNFNKAASKAFVSQPTLSMQIKKLEDQLGVTIFERSHKNFLITDIGKEIVKKAEKILREVEEMKIIAKNSHDIYASELRIGAFPTLSSYYFPKILPKISKKFPRLKIFLIEEKTENLIAKLQNGEIDCALLAMPIMHDFKKHKLFSEPFYLAVSKHNKLAKKKLIDAKDLHGQELMLLEEGHCFRNQALEVCSRMHAFESSNFKGSSLETLKQMVAINMGITLIPKIAAQKNDDIKYLKIKHAPSRDIGIYWRKGFYHAKLIEELYSLIKIDN